MSTRTQVATDQKSLSVELQINGEKVSGKPGQTILEVVRDHNLDVIPTLCYDPKLEPYGSCFLCVVEVKGAPRLLPACVTRIRDGMEVTTRSEKIVNARKTALELLLSDHYADCVCPGQRACPAHVDIQGYLSLARLGYYKEALDLIKDRNPLPVVCGRVCVRKCEVNCLRNNVDEPVGINFVKRFISENASAVTERPKDIAPTGKRVAIIGGGPAGLTCANYLALRGHEVTIYESLPKLGGMLRYGIPEYRLPRTELDEEIRGILDLGVKVQTSKALGKDFTIQDLVKQEKYDSVFVALGAPLGKKMGVKGEDEVEGIRSALDFLRDCDLYGNPELKGKVAVVGGGNSAIDAARTALRCGAEEVTILYRRTRKEMPAHHEEVDAAEKEGVKLELLVAPLEIIAENGRLRALRCQRMELGEPDASGRRKPVPIKGAVTDFACDYLFAAIGQDTDLTVLQDEPEQLRPRVSRWSTLESDPGTMVTNVKGVFAGGDVVLGPSAVIDAIAHGRTAAEAIDGFLRTGAVQEPEPDFKSRRDFFGDIPEWMLEEVERNKRSTMPEREPSERIHDFCQVETGLNEQQTKDEAFRCMECGCKSVFGCDLKRYAAEYNIDIAKFAGEVRRHRVDHSHPLISLDPNKCILCGRCIRTCADIVGLAVLGFVGRGFATTVRPALGKPMAESACIACGACVESCPTGALEAKLPCGRQGPWKTHKISSVCTFCSVGCELDLNVVSDGLLWATAPEAFIPGRGELCLKGRFGTGLIQGADRLHKPLVKKNGQLEEVEWDEAIETAARLLKQQRTKHGAEAIGVMAAPRMTLEEAMLVRHLATAALGTHEVGSFGQNRRGGPRHDLDGILGETASTCTQDDIGTADLIVLAGADPSSSHPVLGMAIRRAINRGAEIIAINSSSIDLLRPSDLWLDARRGTSGIIFSAILHYLLKSSSGNGHGASLAAHEALKSSVAAATLAKAAHISGIDQAKIEACAEKIAGANRVVAVYDLDETLERSTDDLKALAQILILTNHLWKKGEGLLLLQSDCNSEGARIAGVANPLHVDQLRGALVMFENPYGDYRAVKELTRIESLVVIDHFLTETARIADVVLPAATLAESDGTVVSFDGKLGIVNQASRPLPGLTTAEVLARLCRALGLPVRTIEPVQIRAELAASLGISATDLETARSSGATLPRMPAAAVALAPVRLDSTATVANVFPYASLDAILDKKLAELNLVR
jgi:formate dehydrogenase major subunit